MKVYKLEIYVPDFDYLGAEEIKDVLENQKYPNYCINPKVVDIQEKEIGEWFDDHPLNKRSTFQVEYRKLFPK